MDKYDKAILHLQLHPNQLDDAWSEPSTHKAGCLFDYVIDNPRLIGRRINLHIGCLTLIRGTPKRLSAQTPALTIEILGNKALPASSDDLAMHQLPAFAAQQRRIDVALNRV